MKRYARIVKDHVWGPTGSVLFHLIILGLLVRFLVLDIDRGPEPQSIVRMDVVPPSIPLDRLIPLTLDDPNVSEVVPGVDIPPLFTDVEPPLAPPDAPGAQETDYRLFPTGLSPVEIAGVYVGRFGENRKRALKAYGDGFESLTEPAVLNALDWLKAHQYPDGSWGPQYRAAMTGLAVLSFLAHGETTGSEAYGETVRRGLQYLLRRQRDDGWIVAGGPHVPAPQLRVYEHVIATYALAEGYSLTRIPMLRDPLEDAVQVIIDGQMENGGWTYGFALDGPMQIDVSLGGWIIQALRAAELAGVRNRGLSMAIHGGVRGIGTMTDPRGSGRFGYSQRIPGHAPDAVMTGVAVLAMQLSGRAGDEAAHAGLLALRDLRFSWLEDPADRVGHRQQVGRWPLYGWYYITQARFQHNRESWRDWNRQFASGMSGAQNPDGSWCPPPGSIETPYGPVYATTLPALMLQVYYRLLPTYGPIPLDEALTLTDLSDDEPLTIRFQ